MKSNYFFNFITQRIAIGEHPNEQEAQSLLAQGITCILNVGSGTAKTYGTVPFHASAEVKIEDLTRIPDQLVVQALTEMHRMLLLETGCLYVHCLAGLNRSPTIVWLYFIAMGMEPIAAAELIVNARFDANPGHFKLVDRQHLSLVHNLNLSQQGQPKNLFTKL